MKQLKAAVTAIVLLLVSFPLAAETMSLNLNFESTKQSIWGPGAATGEQTWNFTIIDPNWAKFSVNNPSYPGFDGPIETIDTYFFGKQSFGLGYKAKLAASAGLYTSLTVFSRGSVDVKYPVDLTWQFPDQNSFRAGDTVAVYSWWERGEGWQISTQSPQFTFSIDGSVHLYSDFDAKGCLFGCVTANQIIGEVLPTPPIDFTYNHNFLKVDKDSKWEIPPAISFMTPISGYAAVPYVETVATPKRYDLVAEGSDEFARLAVDIDKILTMLAGLKGLGGGGTKYGITAEAHLWDMKAATTLTAHQKVNFAPRPTVSFAFGDTLEWWVRNEGGQDGPRTSGTSAVMALGETLFVKYPDDKKQPTSITPTVTMTNELSSLAEFVLDETLENKLAYLNLIVPSAEIIPRLCTPGFCVPAVKVCGVTIIPGYCVPEICTPAVTWPGTSTQFALYNDNWPIYQYKFPPLVNSSWQMGGFAPVTTQQFALDPENPIIGTQFRATGTKNLGRGHRQVTYVADLSNPGDVTLSEVEALLDLQLSYAGARQWNVASMLSCDGLELNPGFGTEPYLLGFGNTLGVAETKRVILTTDVYPQPDPPLYGATLQSKGVSPLGTLVTSEASDQVILGPGVIDDVTDYVVYGEHFVKIDEIGDSLGHIGSNDFVEVKDGKSGVLAGDLRAGRYLMVHGDISIDYAYAGETVNVGDGGVLRHSGSVNEFATVQPFAIPSAAFAPTTKLAGDVWVPDRGTASLTPGYYGRVTVNRGATLVMAPGVYYVNDLAIEAGASLVYGGAVDVVVQKNVDIGAGAVMSGAAASSEIRFTNLQRGDWKIGEGAMLRGVYSAPRANVSLGRDGTLEGALYGRSVTLNPRAVVKEHFVCDPIADPNCDGTPDCF